MLDEFITTYRDAIITTPREKLTARPWSAASGQELENRRTLFLTQLGNVPIGISRHDTFAGRDRL